MGAMLVSRYAAAKSKSWSRSSLHQPCSIARHARRVEMLSWLQQSEAELRDLP
jgi:hypothetical protein